MERLINVAASGKFIILFSFLFGMGFAVQLQRAESRGARFGAIYARRLTILFIFGVLHGVFLYGGDILIQFALIGALMLPFRRCRASPLLMWAASLYVASFFMVRLHPWFASTLGIAVVASSPGELRELIEQAVRAYGSGSFQDIVHQRLQDLALRYSALIYEIPRKLPFFLLGLWAARIGLLSTLGERASFLRILKYSLAIGITAQALLVLLYLPGVPPEIRKLAIPVTAIGSPALACGYAAAVVLLAQQRAYRLPLDALAAVGRMSLTNYVLQSVFCSALFLSLGLGWYGKTGPASMLALALMIYAAQIVLSVWWLRRFRFGPLEWVWRSLTYGERQRMRV